jgi:uncharacterized protein YndB with AHSA1/START domain
LSEPKTSQDSQVVRRLSRIEARSQQELNCSAEQLYDAWLDPEKIRIWMSSSLKSFGLSGDLRRIETDPRLGGRFCFSDMRNGFEAVHVGEYLVLDRPRKIVFTWIPGASSDANEVPSKVTLLIEPVADGCAATILHEMDAKWAEYLSRTEDSWSRMLKAAASIYE